MYAAHRQRRDCGPRQNPLELEQRRIDRDLAKHRRQARDLVETRLPAEQSRANGRLPAELAEIACPKMCPTARCCACRSADCCEGAAQECSRNRCALFERRRQTAVSI